MAASEDRSVFLSPGVWVDGVRIALLVLAVWRHLLGDTFGFVVLMAASMLLDLLDGHLARRFGQTSRFGEWLDYGIDLVSHSVLWVLSGFPFAPVMMVLEWGAGIVVLWSSSRGSEHWKDLLVASYTPILRRYFANRQRNLLAALAGVSHFCFRIAWYLGYGETWVSDITLPGIIVFEVVTAYMIWVPLRMKFQTWNRTRR